MPPRRRGPCRARTQFSHAAGFGIQRRLASWHGHQVNSPVAVCGLQGKDFSQRSPSSKPPKATEKLRFARSAIIFQWSSVASYLRALREEPFLHCRVHRSHAVHPLARRLLLREGEHHAQPNRQGTRLPRTARTARRLHHPQPVGRRHRKAAGLARLRGPGDHQPRPRQHARPRRQRSDARRSDRQLPHDRRGHRSAGQRRFGELLRARAGGSGRDDTAGGRSRCRRRLDRGLHR